MQRSILIVALGVLAACGAPPERFAAPLAPAGARIDVAVRSLEVRLVSLPAYARDEEIWIETAAGTLTADARRLWADDPARGLTQDLARQLAAMTGARVAAEPWPFADLPAARLEVRLDSFVAGVDGRFRIAGQYIVASESGARDRAAPFEVSAPIAPESGVPGIAVARAQATRDLARLIAREGL